MRPDSLVAVVRALAAKHEGSWLAKGRRDRLVDLATLDALDTAATQNTTVGQGEAERRARLLPLARAKARRV